jgi:hypothetical protein
MRIAAAVALALLALPAAAVEQVRFIKLEVEPFYVSSASREGRPRIGPLIKYNEQLASKRREDIAAARDAMAAEAATTSPMALMVLAIRLYDVGLRDDAVFWFYAARDRLATLSAVLDVDTRALAPNEKATRAFALKAGPAINGYAYCDIAKQKETRHRALAWVAQNPYQLLFSEQLPARPGERKANLQRAIESLRAAEQEDADYLALPANVEKLQAARRETSADEKYCWK